MYKIMQAQWNCEESVFHHQPATKNCVCIEWSIHAGIHILTFTSTNFCVDNSICTCLFPCITYTSNYRTLWGRLSSKTWILWGCTQQYLSLSGECTFPRQGLVRNRLTSTMAQHRLNHPTLMSWEWCALKSGFLLTWSKISRRQNF